jgi:hypothetical protein
MRVRWLLLITVLLCREKQEDRVANRRPAQRSEKEFAESQARAVLAKYKLCFIFVIVVY